MSSWKQQSRGSFHDCQVVLATLNLPTLPTLPEPLLTTRQHHSALTSLGLLNLVPRLTSTRHHVAETRRTRQNHAEPADVEELGQTGREQELRRLQEEQTHVSQTWRRERERKADKAGQTRDGPVGTWASSSASGMNCCLLVTTHDTLLTIVQQLLWHPPWHGHAH
jgi:hypothetical protein